MPRLSRHSTVLLAAALGLVAAASASAQGYWRQQGPPSYRCGAGGTDIAPCLEMHPGGETWEIVDHGADHATFRRAAMIAGRLNTLVWRAEWVVPAAVVPGQVIAATTRGVVASTAYGRPDFPLPYYLPTATWIGWGGAIVAVEGRMGIEAGGAGQRTVGTNPGVRADVPPAGASPEGRMQISTLGSDITVYVPYVWVRGTPPADASVPAAGFAAAGAADAGPGAASASPTAVGRPAPGADGVAAVARNPVVVPPEADRAFFNGNGAGVAGGGAPPTVRFETPFLVRYVMTYHWNGGRGAPAGTLALRRSDGTLFGPWPVTVKGTYYWEASPNVTVPAGRYELIDSDPASWAQNGQTGGAGMADIRGDRR